MGNGSVSNSLLTVSKSDSYAILLCIISFIAWSPVFPGVFGIPTAVIYTPLILLACIISINTNYISLKFIILLSLLSLALILFTLITQSATNFNRTILFPPTLIVTFLLCGNEKVKDRFCIFSSYFCYAALLCAVISFMYALNGGDSIFYMFNPDGRTNGLYFLSFSNAVYGNIIRPSFIYDEPGAFSFVLISVALLRILLKKEEKGTLFILVGGLCTFSLTHIIIVFLYVIFSASIRWKLFIISIVIILVTVSFTDNKYAFFYNRLSVSDAKTINGDNRSKQLTNFIDVVNRDQEVLLLGDYKCHSNANGVCQQHGDISSSPVTPLYRGGIIFFIIQLFTHLALFFCMFKRMGVFPSIALSVLLLQRPFFLSFGYSFIIYSVLFMLLMKMSIIKKNNVHF